MNIYYVYLHLIKDTDSIFYVGKGKNNRAYQVKNRNKHWTHIYLKHGFDVIILDSNMSSNDAYWFEKYLINLLGVENLTNYTVGGDGGDTLTHHPDLKTIGAKISAKCTGDDNPNKGKGFYKWWVEKYGLEIANEMLLELKERRKTIPRKKPEREYLPWKDVLKNRYGENWEEKYYEINAKISEGIRNQPKIMCEYCNSIYPQSKIKQHQLKCIKTFITTN